MNKKSGKSQEIQSCVQSYLQKRHYSVKENTTKVQSTFQMTLSSAVQSATRNPNCIVYGKHGNFVTEFEHFKQWASEVNSDQLNELVLLVFRKFHAEISRRIGQEAADKFRSEHNYELRLDNAKYRIRLGPDLYQRLLKYLTDENSVGVLDVFNEFVDLEVQKDVKVQTKGTKIKQEVMDSAPSTKLFTVSNSCSSLSAAAFSHDGSVLATGTEQSAIHMWHTDTCKNLLPTNECKVQINHIQLACSSAPRKSPTVLRGHYGTVYDVTFLPPDSNLLFSCGHDATLRSWDVSSFENKAIYRGHSHPIWSVDASPLGMFVATGSMDGTARLWMPNRTYAVRIYAGHAMDVDSVKFHPNGSYLATGSSDQSVRLWKVCTGEMVRVFRGCRGGTYALTFSPNGELLATAGEDCHVRVWDLASSKIVHEFTDHTDIIYDLAWSPDGTRLASSSMDGTVRCWPTSPKCPPGSLVFSTSSCVIAMQYVSPDIIYSVASAP